MEQIVLQIYITIIRNALVVKEQGKTLTIGSNMKNLQFEIMNEGI